MFSYKYDINKDFRAVLICIYNHVDLGVMMIDNMMGLNIYQDGYTKEV